MTTTDEAKSASLYYSNGSSDKEYHARIEPKGDGFVVTFAYGRRGSTLTTGTKTTAPVAYDKALAVFDKLISGKQAKGYTFGEDGTPYLNPDSDRQASGLLPQLLNVVDNDAVAELLASEEWCLQEKMDGRRMMLRKTGDTVEAINKLGLIVGVSKLVADAALAIDGDFTLDGEIIGDRLHAFDLLSVHGQDACDWAYSARYVALTELLSDAASAITAVPSVEAPEAKAARLAELKAAGAEGVVFKRLDAVYRHGRPNSGGTQRKFKFVETLSALVSTVNTQRSVGLTLDGDDGPVFVGNVTIPSNHEVPTVGSVVEVRYLYATPTPTLYQPVYLGQRDDVEAAECVLAQVKFKAPTA
ncbi:ATP-dependent DNA ligase (plasmid) [Tsukamurella tyrosinosolvens]|uniref:ATP-dependent DNA ligase n=1 Tax=Tsukamurella tyrosinosolvens TaxID=57704 RepID=A0A1H4U1W3_TSUTY|nr:RNA ligase family protein [Tsukamurella tyrosinosolvens]KXO93036.1 DNA ligase [Tsukamurella tyrosinosolvens]SEC62709.1 ATP-dependent DNA ligase [Tsukamurella tyrosinosolvens]VEH93968.1 ATP-dependent DNA ligase [Tsukamurella tyrosinosolvens]